MTHAAYKKFVDEVVTIARSSVTSNRIAAHGHPVRTNDSDLALEEDEAALKAVFARLNPEERAVLARAFEEERQAAIHDFASFLEWKTSSDEMSITWAGETFGASPFSTMNNDFICRLNGDAWENA